MKEKYIIRNKDKCPISKWQGGETCELYIYPEGASYSNREFLFRISVAQAFADESTYTSLPGVTRHLVSLNGDARLCHVENDTTTEFLIRAQQNVDVFSGDAVTVAHGAIDDFNLMLKGGTTGTTELVNNNRDFTLDYCGYFAVFACNACVHIKADGDELCLEPSSLLLVDARRYARVSIVTCETVIVCRILLEEK